MTTMGARVQVGCTALHYITLHCLQGVSSEVGPLLGQGEVHPSSVPPVGGQGHQNPPGDLGGAQGGPLGNPGLTCRRQHQDLQDGPAPSEQRPRPTGHTSYPHSELQVVQARTTSYTLYPT